MPVAWPTCTIECLHYLNGRADVRCCGCGKFFADPLVGVVGYDGASSVRGVIGNAIEYRLGFEHIPSGPFWPSILAANRNGITKA